MQISARQIAGMQLCAAGQLSLSGLFCFRSRSSGLSGSIRHPQTRLIVRSAVRHDLARVKTQIWNAARKGRA